MSQATSDFDQQIAHQLRTIRAAQGLTLEALAVRAGVSRAMLSRIERGQSSPTAQLLNRLCHGLAIPLPALFAAPSTPPNPLSRQSDQPTWRDPATGYHRRSISPPGMTSRVDIAEITFPPNTQIAFDNGRTDGTDQHVWVLEGQLDLEIDAQTTSLHAGDCLYMRQDRPILFRNPTDTPVRYAVIVCQGNQKGHQP